MVDAAALTTAIAATGCPVQGVSIGDPSDRSTWSVQYGPGVTAAQQQAAAQVIAGWSDPASTVTGRQIKDQVAAGGYSAGLVSVLAKAGQPGGPKPDDFIYWLGIALDTDVPIDNPKVGRLLVKAGCVNGDGSSAVPAFMAAAAGLPA